jgi:hypothetical protein
MSTVQLPNRPVFNSLEPGLDNDLAPPVSRLAIVALILGIFALSAVLSINVVPLAIIIAVLCAVITWRLSRDTSVSGLILAQIGLCLSLTSSAWVIASTATRDAHLYSQAAQHSRIFLDTLAEGKTFEAFELTRAESERQITGTDVAEHYKQLLATPSLPARPDTMPADMSTMQMPSSQALEDSRVKESLQEFLSLPSTKEIATHGKDAQWEVIRGDGISWPASNVAHIQVVMVDKAKPEKLIQVQLNRTLGGYLPEPGKPPVAIWNIDRAKVVKE